MKNDIFYAFKKKDDALFIAAVIGCTFDFKDFQQVDDYLKKFLTILLSRFDNAECISAKKEFEIFSTNQEWKVDYKNCCDDTEKDFEESNTIYRDSKFFQLYSEFIRNFKKSSSSGNINVLYNPRFVAVFLKKYIAFLPLWTSLLSALRTTKVTHANNGIIEGETVCT